MIECENGAYYTGYTRNLARRFRQHLDGTAGVKYTRSHRPVRLAGCWRLYHTVGTALKVESAIKRSGTPAKQRILDDPDALAPLVAARLDEKVKVYPFDPGPVETAARSLEPNKVKTADDPFAGPPPKSNSPGRR